MWLHSAPSSNLISRDCALHFRMLKPLIQHQPAGRCSWQHPARVDRHTHSLTLSLTLTHTYTHPHTHTRTHSHSHTHTHTQTHQAARRRARQHPAGVDRAQDQEDLAPRWPSCGLARQRASIPVSFVSPCVLIWGWIVRKTRKTWLLVGLLAVFPARESRVSFVSPFIEMDVNFVLKILPYDVCELITSSFKTRKTWLPVGLLAVNHER